ncbi:MAG: SufS family cysteine desulfurase [Planctomycetia bacterium]
MHGANDITKAARQLLADAVAAGGAGSPPLPEPEPLVPAMAGVPLPSFSTTGPRSGVTPTSVNAAVPLPELSPAADLSGVRAFVSRIRGLDHLQLPPVRFDRLLAPSATAVTMSHVTHGVLDVDAIRRDFPILRERVHGKPLAWFDNAATTQKPQAVIDAVSHFYAHDNSNIHRGAHTLAARATDAYEHARQMVATFLGANGPDEILFVRGCTEGINLVANILAPELSRGDEIVLTELEHHANIVPWQMVAEQTGAVIRVAPIDDRGDIILEAYEGLLGPRTKVVSFSHASNSLGTILPVEIMTAMAKARGARVLVDGAQSVSHFPVDMRRIGCDFYVFSGHKIFGPTGIGAVFMTQGAQASLPPWQGGGNMIKDVTFAHTTYAEPPAKFEAGTPNIADAIGLGAALDYVTRLGREQIAAHEHHLLDYATGKLTMIDGLRLIGTAREKVGVLSFVIPGLDPIEIGKALDREGIAVRAGHHCAQPSLRRFGLEATVRPSLAFYNTTAEIDRLATAVTRLARGRR